MYEATISELIPDDGPDQQTPSFRALDYASDDKLTFLTNLRLEPLALWHRLLGFCGIGS